MPTMMRTDILILGGGIGGLEVYRKLSKQLRKNKLTLSITLVDANTYYTFVPMLHEVATGAVEPMHCAISLREIVTEPHQFVQATVRQINPDKRQVELSNGTIEYTWCVVALGSAVNYLNVPGAAEHSYNVRTLEAASCLHTDLIKLLESEQTEISVTIVGGGWTGVEVAGQYAQLFKKDVAYHYPHKKTNLSLLEGAPAVLARLPTKIQQGVAARLTRSGVTLHLNERVKAVSKKAVTLSSGQSLASDIVVWTTGFQNVAATYLPNEMCTNGRLPVNSHLVNPKFNTLYAIGDISLAIDQTTGEPYSQLGETAVAQANYVADDIVARLKKTTQSDFTFKNKGNLIPLGDWDGAALIGKLTFFGPLAWLLRRSVYIAVIPTWKARLRILIDWALHSFGHRYILGASQDLPPSQVVK